MLEISKVLTYTHTHIDPNICFLNPHVKKTSLGESLVGSHAYNTIRDSGRDFLRQKVSPKVSDRIICMTPGETRFVTWVTFLEVSHDFQFLGTKISKNFFWWQQSFLHQEHTTGYYSTYYETKRDLGRQSFATRKKFKRRQYLNFKVSHINYTIIVEYKESSR